MGIKRMPGCFYKLLVRGKTQVVVGAEVQHLLAGVESDLRSLG